MRFPCFCEACCGSMKLAEFFLGYRFLRNGTGEEDMDMFNKLSVGLRCILAIRQTG